jgi:hypothetical protein
MHFAVCCGSLSGQVFVSDLLRAFSFENLPNVIVIPCIFELF